jgi:glycosyltransferase involved in cell wall biosynthesis
VTTEAVVFMCGPLAGLSGGDMHAIRLVEAWNQRGPGRALLVAPETIRDHLGSDDEQALRGVRTPLDRYLRGMLSYAAVVLLRTLRACSASYGRAPIAIAASHFVQDVLPCAVRRVRYGSLPVAYVYHLVGDMERAPSVRSYVSRAAERVSIAVLRRSNALVFVDNDETRTSLIESGFPPERVIDTHNAYDPPYALPPRISPASPHAVFLGRFVDEKGIWDVLELARELAKSVPDARVTMLGDGPLRHRLLEVVSRESLQNVDAPGFVPESDKWRLLRSASVFVAPSREEGWGIAVGEALLAGLPVVCYDLPAYRHLGDLPISVPLGERAQFVKLTCSLLTDPGRLDAERERVMSGAASLPRWKDVLAREIDEMSAQANELAVVR